MNHDDILKRLNKAIAGKDMGRSGWCGPGLPGGLPGLRAALRAKPLLVAPPAPRPVQVALPVKKPAMVKPQPIPAMPLLVTPPPAVVRPSPWYLGYTLWKRGLWKRQAGK